MPENKQRKVAFLSSYLPRKCGIATFTNDLVTNLKSHGQDSYKPIVVAMSNERYDYKDPVKFEIRPKVKNDYLSAADYLNFTGVDLVSIQHEFGLFGGDATAAADSGDMIDNIRHPRIWKNQDVEMERYIQLEF